MSNKTDNRDRNSKLIADVYERLGRASQFLGDDRQSQGLFAVALDLRSTVPYADTNTTSNKKRDKSGYPPSLSVASVVVAYPRSGTNFLQNLLRRNFDYPAISIYAPIEDVRLAKNLKSHAISPQYLRDEFRFILNMDFSIDRIIHLHRDPRDVVISFYEFFLSRNQGKPSQKEFLDLDWFLVFSRSETTKTTRRTAHQIPLSVRDALRTHIQSWIGFGQHSSSSRLLRVSYERLVSETPTVLSEVARFLDLPGSGNLESQELAGRDELVATYSSESRPRGSAFAWRDPQTKRKYSTLIGLVEESVADEIKLLGYELQ